VQVEAAAGCVEAFADGFDAAAVNELFAGIRVGDEDGVVVDPPHASVWKNDAILAASWCASRQELPHRLPSAVAIVRVDLFEPRGISLAPTPASYT
jgi:hypothetical protein